MRSRGKSVNRVLFLCSAINDRTAWPYWKLLQMKALLGVTDMSILAFNSQGGSFEARIDGEQYTVKKYAQVKGYQQDLLERFVHRWHDPGRSYFVYGGHGMGDYVDLEQGRVALQVHELADILGKREFEAIVFDSCFMANLDCAYHLRHNTKYIGACEGYMWEPDHISSRHIFNQSTAALMSRLSNPLQVLEQIQRSYCKHSPFADFSVINTEGIEDLRDFVQECVIPRVYDRAAFYSTRQLMRLAVLGDEKLRECESLYNWTKSNEDTRLPSCSVVDTVEAARGGSLDTRLSSSSSPLDLHLPANRSFTDEERRTIRHVQLEHSLYPSLVDDKHLLDLKSYLVDMVREEAAEQQYSECGAIPQWGLAGSSKAVVAMAKKLVSRTLNVHRQGSLCAAPGVPPVTQLSLRSEESGKTRPVLLRGSAQEGLDRFHRVVVSHRGPRAKPIYASRLGGLSFTAHEFSAHSKPKVPWHLPASHRERFDQKVNCFLRDGVQKEVFMPSVQDIPRVEIKRLRRADGNLHRSDGAGLRVTSALPAPRAGICKPSTKLSSVLANISHNSKKVEVPCR